MKTKIEDYIGKKFNRLTILADGGHIVFPSGRKVQVEAQCECGVIKKYTLANLKNGNSKSCGCYNLELLITHGMHKTRQYQCWADMKTRCDNVDHKWYPSYGGRGIDYQESWKQFENFWDDMREGYQDDLTLDRIDNSAGYSKDNCRWSDSSIQSHNQRKSAGSKNKYIGVKKHKTCNYIGASIRVDNKSATLGSYDSEEVAAKAYDDASEILFGDRPNGTDHIEDDLWFKIIQRIKDHREGKKFRPTGSDFKNARHNEDSIISIYKFIHSDEGKLLTQKQIGAIYGITQADVSAIKAKRVWKKALEDV